MTLQQLKYISMVEKCGSFSKAAQNLYVSQPSVSSLVHALEEELGITIFTRSSSGIAITNEGRQLLKLSNKLLRDADYIDEYFQRSAEGPKLSFFISSQHYDFVVSAFEEFAGGLDADRYTLGLNQNQTSVVIESVRKQSSDLGVIFLTKLTEKIICRLLDARELTFHELAAVPPCVFVRKGHPLTKLEHITEEDLDGYPYSSFEQAQGVAVDFAEECQMVSMRKPSKCIIVNNRSTAMNVLANTDAYSTGSGLLAEHLSPANVVTIPLTDKDPVRLGWIYPQNAKLSSHAEGFVRLLEQSIQRSIAYTSSLHRQIVGK